MSSPSLDICSPAGRTARGLTRVEALRGNPERKPQKPTSIEPTKTETERKNDLNSSSSVVDNALSPRHWTCFSSMSPNSATSPLPPPPSTFSQPEASSSLPPVMPSTPTQSSTSRLIASSPGSMSMSKRRTPPAWPRSRERIHTVSGPSLGLSHSQIQSPSSSLFRTPPTPQYSPGQGPSRASQNLRYAISPGPLTAPYTPHRPYPSSAPPRSAGRLRDHLLSQVESGLNSSSSPTRPTYRLVGAPQEWVVKGLNRNAGDVWYDPDSADIHVRECFSFRLSQMMNIAYT